MSGPRIDQSPKQQFQRYTPPPPPPREQVDNAVRKPQLHGGQPDAPPPERYVQHEVERGETLTEVADRYQTTVPMIQAANPQIEDANQIDVGQQVNVPIGAGYGREPVQDVVAPGETLTSMARQHPGVSPQDIARANRHEIPDANRVQAGQEVWVPNHGPATPLEQKVQATDGAVAEVNRAQKAYDGLPPDTNRAVREEMHQSVQTTKNNLKTAVQAELDERVKASLPAGAAPTEADYTAAGKQLKDRYQADPVATQRLDSALTSLAGDRYRASPEGQAEAIVNQARHAGDAPQQMEALNTSLKDATPEVRDAVLNSAEGKKLVQAAAAWATEPLAGGDAQKADDKARQEFNGAGQQVPGAKTMERLEQITRDLDPALAAQLVGEALPTVEKYTKDFKGQFGSQPFGPTGMANMLKVLDRGADTPAGQANIEKMAELGIYDRDALRLHVAEGGSPVYAIALSKQPGVDSAAVLQQAYDGVASYRARIAETAEEYSGHMEELGWLVQSHGGAMTPEQLQQAIEAYTKEKGPEWEQKGKDLQDKLAAQGATLQQQLTALSALPEGTPGRADALAEALSDPAGNLALNTAWEKKPELLEGARGDSLLTMLADPTVRGSSKVTDAGRKLIAQAGTTFVQHQIRQFQNFDPGNAASVARLESALQRMESPAFAKYLGVEPGALKSAVTELRKLTPQAGDTLDTVAQRVKDFNTFLQSDDGLGRNIGLQLRDPATGKPGLYEGKEGLKAFDKNTFAGQLLRGFGVAVAGVGLAGSAAVATTDQSPDRIAKVLVDAAGLANKVTELRIGTGAVADTGAAKVIGGKVAGRVLGVVASAFDFIAAGRAFSEGDAVKGGLYATGGVGGVMTALAAGGVWGGPVAWVGLGLIALSAGGLIAWDHHQQVTAHEPGNDGGTSMRFLQNAGLSEAAARALTDQSGDGHSVMPLLNRYAELKGLNLQDEAQQRRFAGWLNALSPDQLAALRDNLHHTADDIEGDPERFHATADGDAQAVADIAERPWSTRSGDRGPESVAQLEAQLDLLAIPLLAP